MTKSKLEYIWLDGYKPTQTMRSKTLVVDNFSGKLEDAPQWSFDGSSTEQAEGNSSDCLLHPVFIVPDPTRKNGYLVMTEVLNADGTPTMSNAGRPSKTTMTISGSVSSRSTPFGTSSTTLPWDFLLPVTTPHPKDLSTVPLVLSSVSAVTL
jgi:hypothetical protein